MISFIHENQAITRKFRDMMDQEESRHNLEVEKILQLQKLEYEALTQKCVDVNGKHIDDGGMFVATCVNCGFSDDYYDPS